MKVLSLFSGIGAFEKALVNLEIPFELIGFSEIDKYAVNSYCAIHGVDESLNLGDITKVDEKALPKDIDLITYGFPCQDISLAGKLKGLFNEDGTQTRSGLFFEALRIIEETQPKVAIAENVKNLTGKKFKEQFQIVLDSLNAAGYNNYWQVLNAKDYGIPQNRERVFIVSIRKDIDKGLFKFPEGFPLELRLKDILESKVDEKFFLTESRVTSLIEHKKRNLENGNGFGARIVNGNDIASTLATSPDKSSCQYLAVKENTKQGYAEAVEGDSINLEQPNSKTRRGRVGKQVAQTLTTSPQQVAIVSDLRIRKLTPKECFRLMGFNDSDFHKAEAVNSNTQLYKQAGNSIVVDVVEYIIKALLECGALENRKENEMELRVNTPTFPEVIEFNFDELKHEITERASAYVNLVYTEDQIQDAKKDRATLNKFVKALSDERIKIKKECLKPYEDFEKKIKELDGIVNKAILNIDKQVKGFEDQKKAERLEKIREYFQKACFPDWVKFEMILDQKWLNASVSLNTAHGAIDSMLECIEKDLATLSSLPEFGFEAKEVYKCTLDIRKALETANGLSEMQKRKAELEAKEEKPFSKCMNPPEEDAVWISFAAKITPTQAGELRDFFLARGIEFKPL